MKFHQNNLFKKNTDQFDIAINIFTFQKCLYFLRSFKLFCSVLQTPSPTHGTHGLQSLVPLVSSQSSIHESSAMYSHCIHYVTTPIPVGVFDY